MVYATSWSTPSLILYIFLGVICSIGCYLANQRAIRTGHTRKITNAELMPWYLSWILIAVFRMVSSTIGGTDAPNYIYYFENVLSLTNDNTDIFFRIFNGSIRAITDNYRVYFFIYYTIIVASISSFVMTFSNKKASTIPYTIIFYLYLRSFTSMRSNLAIAILLLAIIFIEKRKFFLSFVFAILALLTHVSAFIYVAFILFYYIYKEKKIKLLKSIFILAFTFFAGVVGQNILTSGSLTFLSNISTGAYASYAGRAEPLNLFLSYSVSNLPQLALFIVLVVFRKRIDQHSLSLSNSEKNKLNIIRLMCYFDMFVVPIITILSVYRGYEYFYVARLIMWGELIAIFKRRFNRESRVLISIFFWLVFVVWMYGRIEATWESSQLMPYVLDLFVN